MSDTITRSAELKIENLFVDGDTRTFNMKNPKSGITSAEIEELNTFMQTNNIIVGDRYGGRFGKITKATTVRKLTTTLDLSEQQQ